LKHAVGRLGKNSTTRDAGPRTASAVATNSAADVVRIAYSALQLPLTSTINVR
jgi:hypothetical protein